MQKKREFAAVIIVLFCVMGTLFALPQTSVTAAAKTSTKKLRMSKSTVYITAGKTATLKIKGKKSTDKIRWWKSANTKVATVDKNGKVSAVKGGTTKVKVKVGKKTLTTTVRVVGVSTRTVSVAAKKTYKVKVSNGKSTKWSSSNKKIAKVSSAGTITGVSTGSATITCKTRSRTFKIKVYVPALSITSLKMVPNDTLKLNTKNAGEAVTYSSSNPDVASVDSAGNITSKKVGTAVIYSKTGSATLSAKIQVVSGITTSSSSLPASSGGAKKTVTVNARGGTRTYTVYAQSYSANQSTVYPKYLSLHGCAASSLATMLSGMGILNTEGKAITPAYVIETVEKNVLSNTALGNEYQINYSKSSASKMPISLLGFQKVLNYYGIPSTYVQKFDDQTAYNQIMEHLLKGMPVVIEVTGKNRTTGVYDYLFANSSHTMVLLGVTDKGKVIVADPADRTSTYGALYSSSEKRLKYVSLDVLLPYMRSCTATPTASYYNKVTNSVGYLLIQR